MQIDIEKINPEINSLSLNSKNTSGEFTADHSNFLSNIIELHPVEKTSNNTVTPINTLNFTTVQPPDNITKNRK